MLEQRSDSGWSLGSRSRVSDYSPWRLHRRRRDQRPLSCGMVAGDHHRECSCRRAPGDKIYSGRRIAPETLSIYVLFQKSKPTYIVENHTLSLVKTHPKRPFLPFNDLSGFPNFRNFEAGTFWLHHVQWLQVGPQVLVLGSVLVWWRYPKGLRLFGCMVSACRAHVNADDFEIYAVHDRRDSKWECIMIRVHI